jgi:DNA polymerase beta
MSTQTDYKQSIIQALQALSQQEEVAKERFKAIAYQKVIKELKNLSTPIYTIDDVKGVKGVGEKIKKKIEEIISTGSLQRVEKYKQTETYNVTEQLLNIYGVGPAKVNELINAHKISSIDELRSKPELLNEKQLIGLTHYEDFLLRIPRAEMDEHNKYIKRILKKVSPNFEVQIVGSFRRDAISSGDIDVLITHPSDSLIGDPELMSTIIQSLNVKYKYITDILGIGAKKCLGVAKLKDSKHFRRIDFLLTTEKEYPFALLYFTGNDKFNVDMRNHALSRGYSLSEHGLKDMKTDKLVTGLKTEKGIFNFLELKYVEPNMRK